MPCASQRTGQAGGLSLSAAFDAAKTPTDVQAIVQSYAAPGALSTKASIAMGAFGLGELAPPELASVIAGAGQLAGTEGNPFVPPIGPESMGIFGAVFAAQPEFAAILPLLSAAAALVGATFSLFGMNAEAINTGPSCGNINLATGVIPHGPNDPGWNPYPWKPGQELASYVAPDGTTYATTFPSSPDQSNGLDMDLWAEFQAADPTSFRRFCYGALLANAELEWNCQPNKVNEQSVIVHCVEEWNNWHASTSADYTIEPFEGALSWNYVPPLEQFLGRSGYTQGMSAGAQYIHGGPLFAVGLMAPSSAPVVVASRPTTAGWAAMFGPGAPAPAAPRGMTVPGSMTTVPRATTATAAAIQAVHAATTGNETAQQQIAAIQLCARAGDATCQAELAVLESAEKALEKTVGYWVDYWLTPRAERSQILAKEAWTLSQDKVRQLAGGVPRELVEAARRTRNLPRPRPHYFARLRDRMERHRPIGLQLDDEPK